MTYYTANFWANLKLANTQIWPEPLTALSFPFCVPAHLVIPLLHFSSGSFAFPELLTSLSLHSSILTINTFAQMQFFFQSKQL